MTPRKLELLVLTGMRNADGKTAKGDAAFSKGVEHVVFRYKYEINVQEPIDPFKIPFAARKLMR
ncbi:MAG: hypothetical protein OSB09_05330 [Planctomycetota bacterium]|nr:hypothetical protein [Planctomycetota bacterium]